VLFLELLPVDWLLLRVLPLLLLLLLLRQMQARFVLIL
jgi:hypothetical protein